MVSVFHGRGITMQILAPDILEDARGLSVGITATAFVIGLLIWLLGWRGHRFWIVLVATVGAGIYGLNSGPAFGSRPVVAGLLLAVASGVLALAMVRVVAFVAGGTAAWIAVHALLPAWHEPLVCFVVGGLAGVLLFRVWTMVLTSSAGTVLMAYSGLCLAQNLGNVDAVAVAEKQTTLLNCACGGIALLGLMVQYYFSRARDDGEEKHEHRSRKSSRSHDDSSWFGSRAFRRAG
jgi:hypothetical protein